MWVKMNIGCVNEDKGYLERNKSYNLPKELAKQYIENDMAEKTSKDE